VVVHLIEVDAAQHRFGIWSPEAKRAIEEDDRQLGRLVQEVTRRGWDAETAWVVASDHGFRSAPKVVRPCTLLTQAGYISVKDGKITDWQATVLANAGTAYVYVKDSVEPAARQAIHQLFATQGQEPGSGLGKLYEPEEIRALGGDPSAFLALGAAKDYQFGGGCLGDYATPGTYVATHGFDPRDPEMFASLLMMGPTIQPCKIPEARLIDIAPTIAEWLGFSLPQAEGVPLKIASGS
jgi:predicted AlkP superfamily pyrophosphatase or phosphodiesterase